MVTQGLFESIGSDPFTYMKSLEIHYYLIFTRKKLEFPLASSNGAGSWNPQPLFQLG